MVFFKLIRFSKLSCLLSFILNAGYLLSQDGNKIINPGKSWQVSAGPAISLGRFSDTHLGGFLIEFGWSRNQFGKLSSKKEKKIFFTANTGLGSYFGKREIIGSADFHYPAFTYINIAGGILYKFLAKGNINLTGGPAAGIYRGKITFNTGASLKCNYYISPKIAITPGLIMMKETGSDAIWSGSIQASLAF